MNEVHFTRSILSCNILYLADLEELLEGSEQSSTTAKNDVKFSLWVSFCEIYNECFYDLSIPVSNDKKNTTPGSRHQGMFLCKRGLEYIANCQTCNLKSQSSCNNVSV